MTYCYECDGCGEEFALYLSSASGDAPSIPCPKCSGKAITLVDSDRSGDRVQVLQWEVNLLCKRVARMEDWLEGELADDERLLV